MRVVGVDPGLTGAVASIDNTGGGILFYDTPTLQVKSGKSYKNVIDMPAAVRILQELKPTYLVIEKVQAMPGGGERSMGATSAFNFGMGFGIWLGIIAAMKIPYEQVHPATWKAKLMAGMTKDKDASRLRAMQIYPDVADRLNLKKHHGRADALLLATYGFNYSLTNCDPKRLPPYPAGVQKLDEQLF